MASDKIVGKSKSPTKCLNTSILVLRPSRTSSNTSTTTNLLRSKQPWRTLIKPRTMMSILQTLSLYTTRVQLPQTQTGRTKETRMILNLCKDRLNRSDLTRIRSVRWPKTFNECRVLAQYNRLYGWIGKIRCDETNDPFIHSDREKSEIHWSPTKLMYLDYLNLA